jgi:hypothetical protein
MRTNVRCNPFDSFETFRFPTVVASCQQVGADYETFLKIMMSRCKKGMWTIYDSFDCKNEKASKIRTLRKLHGEMDYAVAGAYGWTDLDLGHGFHETKQGVRFTISEPGRREVLQRLLKLNHESYAEEVKQGLHTKKKRRRSLGAERLATTLQMRANCSTIRTSIP